jgi:hypothetical protein
MRPSQATDGIVSKITKSHHGNRSSGKPVECYRCGGNLAPNCDKPGHYANRRKSKVSGKPGDPKPRSKQGGVKLVADDRADDDSLGIYNMILAVSSEKSGYFVNVDCNVRCDMQVDMTADFSIMSKSVFDFASTLLVESKVQLRTYTGPGDEINVCGEFLCNVKYNEQKVALPMVVVDHDNRPTLMGRNWLSKFKLNWA